MMKFIKSYRLFESKEWVENIISACKKYKIQNYQINGNGTIDVIGHVNLSGLDLKECPVKFNRISGDLDISSNHISTFVNFPKFIDGNLYVMKNKIKSFETCEVEYIGKKLNLSYNPFDSLEGCPSAEDHVYANISNITTISDDELNLFHNSANNIYGIVNTPIFALLESINWSLFYSDDEDRRNWSRVREVLFKVNEFEVIKDRNTIDVISLNQLFDYYNKTFNLKSFKDKYERWISPSLSTTEVEKVQIPYTFINI